MAENKTHYWILEVNGDPSRWAWRGKCTSRGGLDMQAFRSKAEAKPALFEARKMYGYARLVKFYREGA